MLSLHVLAGAWLLAHDNTKGPQPEPGIKSKMFSLIQSKGQKNVRVAQPHTGVRQVFVVIWALHMTGMLSRRELMAQRTQEVAEGMQWKCFLNHPDISTGAEEAGGPPSPCIS